MLFRQAAAVMIWLTASLYAFPQSPPGSVQTLPSRPTSLRPGYVGDPACISCHEEVSKAYAHTAHKLTSQLATRQSVLGDFSSGANVLTISNPKTNPALPGFFFKMEASGSGFIETASTGWENDLISESERIDIVTGSGTRGQTYLYWQGDRLFELPVSYWTDGHRWVNSPGYIDGTADFSRPVNPGCLECHATYIRPLSSDVLTNRYEKDTFVAGISCETCHGPGAEHASKYAATPAASSSGTAILNPAKFSRDRQVDACAYCHNGIQRQASAPAFSFIPGRPLSEFFKPLPTEAEDHPDVHGNQVGLLERSRCYQSSPNMSCSTCHNTHEPEKPAASYAIKCLSCHQWTSCTVSRKLGHPVPRQEIVAKCIDCHMPVETTTVIVSETAGDTVRAKMRNHWIKVYAGKPLP